MPRSRSFAAIFLIIYFSAASGKKKLPFTENETEKKLLSHLKLHFVDEGL